jgi:hypothetical protein
MHGSRRKLEQSLRKVPGLRGRFECSTLDSVALRWTNRWRSLCARLGYTMPDEGEFDATCALAARLLDMGSVRQWVTASFPVVLIDEAQDLSASRLAIVQALAREAHVFAAGDEFQCLQDLKPNPFEEWARSGLGAETLTRIRRTDVPDLLSAAAALRAGQGPTAGPHIQIRDAPSSALAGGHIVNAIAWYGKGGTVAVLTPSLVDYVTDSVAWATQKRSSRGHGPMPIAWEQNQQEEARQLRGKLQLPERAPIEVVRDAVDRLGAPGITAHLHNWIARQRNALGRGELARTEVERAMDRALANRNRFAKDAGCRLAAMTVYAAKNREFDGVIVLWPYKVAGSADHKRRLLYNAITRAKRWALILVQNEKILSAAPFK